MAQINWDALHGALHGGQLPPLIRYDRWMKRVFEQQLGSWGEHWADISATKQFAAWRQPAKERGASADLKYHMTRGLLPEVLYAAGGVERELEQLRTALAEVQQFADEAATLHPLPSSTEWPAWGCGVSTPAMRDASYSFANLLSWARSVVERTSRPYKPRSAERAGLLPALAPGQLRDQVQVALDDLEAVLKDSGASQTTPFTPALFLEAGHLGPTFSPTVDSWPACPTQLHAPS